MLSVIMLISVVIAMVLLCSYQCNCILNNNVKVRASDLTKDSLAALPKFDSRTDDIHLIGEHDDSALDNMNLEKYEKNTESTGIHNYFLSFLPSCPKAYKLTLHQNTSRSGNGTNDKRKKYVQLRTGQYTLCKNEGTARLQAYKECSGTAKPCQTPTSEFWISDIESLHRDELAPAIPTPVISVQPETQTDKDNSKKLDENCQPRKCSSKQLMAINMKNHLDCGSFYICIMGHHFLLHCPPDNQFSEEYGVCIEKKFANCEINSSCKR